MNSLNALQASFELDDKQMAALLTDRTGEKVSASDWKDAVDADAPPEGWEAVLRNTPMDVADRIANDTSTSEPEPKAAKG